MIIKLEIVNGSVEVFKAEKYILARPKQMHPDIVSATIFSDDGKKILAKKARIFKWLYKKFFWKPLTAEEAEMWRLAAEKAAKQQKN